MAPDLFTGGAALFGVGFALFFGFAVLVIVAVGVFVVVSLVRNAKKVSAAGHDPLTLQSEIALKALDSDLLAKSESVEQRLLDVDNLLARKLISEQEHAAARAAILASA